MARAGSGAKGVRVLTRKNVSWFGGVRLDRKNEVEASEWKNEAGRVVATEVLRVVEGDAVVPTLELSAELDAVWREVVLSLWATRLWVAFGVEKTAMLGGRLANARLAKHWLGGAMVGDG